jgi:hypothetical protein
MTTRQKLPPPRPKNLAYRQAFEQLDAALAENSRSDDSWKIDLLRLKVFGCLPETGEIAIK